MFVHITHISISKIKTLQPGIIWPGFIMRLVSLSCPTRLVQTSSPDMLQRLPHWRPFASTLLVFLETLVLINLTKNFQLIMGKCSNILFYLLWKTHEKSERRQLLSISLKSCSFEFVTRKKYAQHKKNIVTSRDFLNFNFYIH